MYFWLNCLYGQLNSTFQPGAQVKPNPLNCTRGVCHQHRLTCFSALPDSVLSLVSTTVVSGSGRGRFHAPEGNWRGEERRGEERRGEVKWGEATSGTIPVRDHPPRDAMGARLTKQGSSFVHAHPDAAIHAMGMSVVFACQRWPFQTPDEVTKWRAMIARGWMHRWIYVHTGQIERPLRCDLTFLSFSSTICTWWIEASSVLQGAPSFVCSRPPQPPRLRKQLPLRGLLRVPGTWAGMSLSEQCASHLLLASHLSLAWFKNVLRSGILHSSFSGTFFRHDSNTRRVICSDRKITPCSGSVPEFVGSSSGNIRFASLSISGSGASEGTARSRPGAGNIDAELWVSSGVRFRRAVLWEGSSWSWSEHATAGHQWRLLGWQCSRYHQCEAPKETGRFVFCTFQFPQSGSNCRALQDYWMSTTRSLHHLFFFFFRFFEGCFDAPFSESCPPVRQLLLWTSDSLLCSGLVVFQAESARAEWSLPHVAILNPRALLGDKTSPLPSPVPLLPLPPRLQLVYWPLLPSRMCPHLTSAEPIDSFSQNFMRTSGMTNVLGMGSAGGVGVGVVVSSPARAGRPATHRSGAFLWLSCILNWPTPRCSSSAKREVLTTVAVRSRKQVLRMWPSAHVIHFLPSTLSATSLQASQGHLSFWLQLDHSLGEGEGVGHLKTHKFFSLHSILRPLWKGLMQIWHTSTKGAGVNLCKMQ